MSDNNPKIGKVRFVTLCTDIFACAIFIIGVPLGILGVAGYNISISHENNIENTVTGDCKTLTTTKRK